MHDNGRVPRVVGRIDQGQSAGVPILGDGEDIVRDAVTVETILDSPTALLVDCGCLAGNQLRFTERWKYLKGPASVDGQHTVNQEKDFVANGGGGLSNYRLGKKSESRAKRNEKGLDRVHLQSRTAAGYGTGMNLVGGIGEERRLK